ncbi:MAG: alpha/beta fold hydrolase [Candidatus Tectomicrobia bacterium]|nr:alpha/beta fold hydrolase [Candidatus Tectomicrobia bacterium]
MPQALVNGIMLNYTEAGRGEAVLFMHAYGWSHAFWLPQVRRYAAEFRAVAVDCRGHGDSDKPRAPYSIDGFADDHLALCDALGIERAHLVGTSMGGCLAMIMALKRPQFARSLVLIGTWASADPMFHKYHHETIAMLDDPANMEAYARRRIPIIFSPGFLERNPQVVDSEVARGMAADRKALQLTSEAFLHYDIVDQISAIKAPTMVLVGSEDRLDPPHLSLEIYERIPGSEYVEILGSGHLPSMEQPEEFDRIVLTWLRRHAGA